MTEEPPLAIVPVNRLERAKGRLAELLSPSERAALALATLNTVLASLDAAGIEAVVLCADPGVLMHLRAAAHLALEDPRRRGLTEQLETLIANYFGDPILILHADLPLADAGAIRELVEASPAAPSCTLVRSADGGTNAMLVRPAGRFALAYGPGSFAKHEAAARAAGMTVEVVESPALALDLDTPADLRTLLGSEEGRASPAGRLLESFGVASRLAT